MWILFRLAVFLMGVAYQFFAISRANAQFKSVRGVLVQIKNQKNTKTNQETSSVSLKIKSRLFFRLLPENSGLQWYKSAGFGQEIQVGDKKFDEAFYIAAENHGIIDKLRADSQLRDSILKLHALGYTNFVSDGFGHLDMENPNASTVETDEFFATLEKIKNSLELVPSSSFMAEPFVFWVVAMELLFCGLLAYAYSLQITLITEGLPHLDLLDFALKGLIGSGILISAWFIFIWAFLRRSPRAPVLLFDFTLPYCLIALVAGIMLFADLNHLLDQSPISVNQAVVIDKDAKSSGTTSRRSAAHYLSLEFTANPDNLPARLMVPLWSYYKYSKGDGIEIRVRRGFFNSPYVDGDRAIPNPKQVSVSVDSSKVDFQRARNLAGWIPASEPQVKMDGPVSWAEEKYRSGKIRQKEPFVDARRHGLATYWHENGKVYTTINWVNGEKQGRVKIYYPSGAIEQSLNYRNGKLHGLCAWYDEQGVVTNMALYDNGDVVSADMQFLSEIEKEMGRSHLR